MTLVAVVQVAYHQYEATHDHQQHNPTHHNACNLSSVRECVCCVCVCVCVCGGGGGGGGGGMGGHTATETCTLLMLLVEHSILIEHVTPSDYYVGQRLTCSALLCRTPPAPYSHY